MASDVEDNGEELPSYGALYTVEEFRKMVAYGVLIDYDGHGNGVVNGRVYRSCWIVPSRVNQIPQHITHVVWFNR